MDGSLLWFLMFTVPMILLWLWPFWDVFRRDDLTTARRIVWFLVVLLLPFIGAGIYIIARLSVGDTGVRDSNI